MPEQPLPNIVVGQDMDVEIGSIGEKGDGIAKTKEGFVIFVPNTREGEKVKIKITKISRTCGFGEVVR